MREKRKLNRWFLNCILTYVSIFSLVLVLMTILYSQFYTSTKEAVRNGYESRLGQACDTLVETLNRACSFAETLSENSAALKLSAANASSLKSNVLNMRSAMSTLERWHGVLGEEYLANFLVYPHNDYVVANFAVMDNYLDSYGVLFSFGELSAREWRELLLNGSGLQMVLGKAMAYKSAYLQPDSQVILPFIVPVFNGTSGRSVASMCFCLDVGWITQLMADKDGILFQLIDRTGEILLGEECPDDEYLVLSRNVAESPAFSLRLAVPVSVVSRQLDNGTRVMSVYIIAGLLGILLLSAIYAVRYFSGFRELLRFGKQVSPEMEAGSSPFLYVQDLLTNLSGTRDTLKQKLMLMESTFSNNLLENACLRGIASSADLAQCEKMLGERCGLYCAAVMRIFPEYQAKIPIIEAETLFEKRTNAVTIHATPEKSVFIVGLKPDETPEQLVGQFRETFGRYGVIGISGICSGAEMLHGAYQQAHDARGKCTPEDPIQVFQTDEMAWKPVLDLERLGALQNMIQAGKKEPVDAFFLELEEQAQDVIGINQFQMFFVIRQILVRLERERPGKKSEKDSLFFLSDETSREGLERMRLFALELTERFSESQSENPDNRISRVISVIECDFGNPDMSAGYLAEKLGCSQKYIYQIVKEQLNKTVGDLIEETRLQFAEELLLNTEKKNEEIAALCGFGTINTFYRIFRKKYGVPPGEWRKQKQNESNNAATQ